MTSIQYVPLGHNGFRSTIVTTARESTRFIELEVTDVATDPEPALRGDSEYQANNALVGSLLSFGSHEHAAREAEDPEIRASNAKAAKRLSAAALQIAEYSNLGGHITRKGWCSSCFELTDHREVDARLVPAVHLCLSCGETTSVCVPLRAVGTSHGVPTAPSGCRPSAPNTATNCGASRSRRAPTSLWTPSTIYGL